MVKDKATNYMPNMYWDFSMDEINTMLENYTGGHNAFPVAHDVVGKFTEQYKEAHNIRNSVKDSDGNTLTAAQQEFFKDSKIRDEDGNLLVVYHGTDADFNIFDFQRGGEHGTAEGYGIYLADIKDISYSLLAKECHSTGYNRAE